MKNKTYQLMVALSIAIFSISSHAQEPAARIASMTNPTRNMGVHIGDVLNRKIELDVAQPYQISKNAYPIKGENQNGIELIDLKVKPTKHGKSTHYSLNLSYQVFASSKLPSVMQLPAETLVLTGGPKALTIEISAWRFWFSPLVDSDLLTAKINVQPQQMPDLIDIRPQQTALIVCISLLVISLIALVYVNADRRWLPFMGGAFAQAHRRIKRLSKTPAEVRKALFYLHQAFNQTYGSNVFADDVDAFLAAHPSFGRMRAEITDFFERSNKSLFAAHSVDGEAFMRDLVTLSRNLRDCERKL
ncbi:MAG TPA: nonribosomal peptide synthetase MxaA [Methylophilaceae bacterium]